MGKYIARRFVLMLPTLLILSLIVFAIMRVIPGDVAYMILSGGGQEVTINEKALQALREQLGLTAPLPVQYLDWMWDTVRGDLGKSLVSRESVAREMFTLRLPLTLEIAVLAMALSLAVGIPVGIISAVKQNSWIDLTLRFWSIFFLAAPTFWLGVMVLFAGLYWFRWVPSVGYHPIWSDPWTNLTQVMWPVLILASHNLAIAARLTRSTMLEVMREDYIRTARAKGLRENIVIVRHALKNALIPVVTVAGLQFAGLLGGTVILEVIFGIPGMGSWFLYSINYYDYPTVQGIIVVFAVIFMVVNLAIDLFYGWLDPRISYA